MTEAKKDILAELQKKILPLQGFRLPGTGNHISIDLGPVNSAFPNNTFPVGAVHEFISSDAENFASTTGYIASLLSSFMRNGEVAVWISAARTVFPPSLKIFNIEPDHIIFIDVQKEKDILWVMEETLKCGGIAAVIAEVSEVSFTASRRLQLAVEQTGVTGFLLRHHLRNLNTIACIARWKITSLPSSMEDDLPGVGYPRWNVELLKIRNGHPGTWQIEWFDGRLHPVSLPSLAPLTLEQKTKTG